MSQVRKERVGVANEELRATEPLASTSVPTPAPILPPILPIGIRKLTDNSLASAIMGILNFTSDSFSGDGLLLSNERASDKTLSSSISALLRQAESFLRAGADWLDIGAESTRPGASPLGLEEERRRLLAAVAALLDEFPDALISVDTRKNTLAREAFSYGARMLNDVSGSVREQLWASLEPYGAFSPTATSGWIVLMHNTEARFQEDTAALGGNSWQPCEPHLSETASVLSRLRELASSCEGVGVAREKIILDAGLGFGKTFAQNLALLGDWSRISALGYPSLLGASRKSFLGRLINEGLVNEGLANEGAVACETASASANSKQRLEGSLAACALAVAGGARLLRVHDVAETSRFVNALHAMRSGIPSS